MVGLINLASRRYGTLRVVRQAPSDKLGRAMWFCVCDCGQETLVSGAKLRAGAKKSCGKKGCYSKAWIVNVAADELRAWNLMLARCYNKNNPSFKSYGGRGIKVCARWKSDFSQFLSDMGPRPTSRHSLDRHPNNDGQYEPGNCRWATGKEQMRNTRKTIYVEYEGKRLPLVELSERFGLTRKRVAWRLDRGWSLEDALLTPASRQNRISNNDAKRLYEIFDPAKK